MADVLVLGEFEVVEDGSRRRDARGEVLHAEALERLRAELAAELFAVHLLRKDPLVEAVGVVLRPEGLRKVLLATTLVDNLFRSKVREQLVDVRIASLRNVELAGRDVEEGDAGRLAAEIDGGQIDVLLVREDVLLENHAGGHQLDDTALDQPLDQFGVLQLFADGDALARTHQLGQVGVDGVVGEAGQLDIRRRAVGPPREGDAQNAAGTDCILAEGFVEVTHAEQQDCIGVHRLDGVVLLHQRGFDILLVVDLRFFALCHGLFLQKIVPTKIADFAGRSKCPAEKLHEKPLPPGASERATRHRPAVRDADRIEPKL